MFVGLLDFAGPVQTLLREWFGMGLEEILGKLDTSAIERQAEKISLRGLALWLAWQC